MSPRQESTATNIAEMKIGEQESSAKRLTNTSLLRRSYLLLPAKSMSEANNTSPPSIAPGGSTSEMWISNCFNASRMASSSPFREVAPCYMQNGCLKIGGCHGIKGTHRNVRSQLNIIQMKPKLHIPLKLGRNSEKNSKEDKRNPQRNPKYATKVLHRMWSTDCYS